MNTKSPKRMRLVIKTISVVVLFFFVCTYIFNGAWAIIVDPLTMPKVDKAEMISRLNVDTFSISPQLGTIKYASKGDSDIVIVHIQDAHCNYAAQNKIAEIVEFLNKEYGIGVVNLEGGTGNYDLSVFTRIYDKDIRKDIADYFVRWGQVNGAELFAINNPEKVTLWGVEDTDLYIKNLDVYRESLGYKDATDKYIKELDYFMRNLKIHIFSEELLQLDIKYAEYKTNKIEFKEYLKYLLSMAKQKGIKIKSYSNIYLLSQALEQEDKIDFRRANNEREELIDRLRQVLSKNDLKELISKTVQFRNKTLSQTDFYEYLIEKARLVGQKMEDFPELRKFIIYISLYGAVDKFQVMQEMEALEGEIKESLYTNDKQRELGILSKNLVLTRNIFDISFTKEDYVYYKKNKAAFDVQNYIRFIEREAPLYRITAKLDENIGRLDEYRNKIFKFYEYSFERDRIFLEKIKLSGGKTKTGIIVTGGFHTENLLELFQKEGVSYVSIIPNFKMEEGYESPYFRVLSGGMSPLERSIEAAMSALQVYDLFCGENSERVWGPERLQLMWLTVEAMREMLHARKYGRGEDRARAIEFADNAGFLLFEFNARGDVVCNHVAAGTTLPAGCFVAPGLYNLGDFASIRNALHQVGQDRNIAEGERDIARAERAREFVDSRLPDDGILKTALNSVWTKTEYIDEDGNVKPLPEGQRGVQVVKGLLQAHAGQMVYLPSLNADGRELSDEELAAKLVHELVAGTFRGGIVDGEEVDSHTLAANVEGAFVAALATGDYAAMERLLEDSRDFGYKVEDRHTGEEGIFLWDMEAFERLELGAVRDLAAPTGIAAPDTRAQWKRFTRENFAEAAVTISGWIDGVAVIVVIGLGAYMGFGTFLVDYSLPLISKIIIASSSAKMFNAIRAALKLMPGEIAAKWEGSAGIMGFFGSRRPTARQVERAAEPTTTPRDGRAGPITIEEPAVERIDPDLRRKLKEVQSAFKGVLRSTIVPGVWFPERSTLSNILIEDISNIATTGRGDLGWFTSQVIGAMVKRKCTPDIVRDFSERFTALLQRGQPLYTGDILIASYPGLSAALTKSSDEFSRFAVEVAMRAEREEAARQEPADRATAAGRGAAQPVDTAWWTYIFDHLKVQDPQYQYTRKIADWSRGNPDTPIVDENRIARLESHIDLLNTRGIGNSIEIGKAMNTFIAYLIWATRTSEGMDEFGNNYLQGINTSGLIAGLEAQRQALIDAASGNMGRWIVVVDGEEVLATDGFMTDETERAGRRYLVVTHTPSGDKAEVEITEAPEITKGTVLDSLRAFRDNAERMRKRGIGNTLTDDEMKAIESLVERVGAVTDVSAIEYDERVIGHFGTNNRLYLNKVLVENPMALLHERIHSMYFDVPTGAKEINIHTVARGWGDDPKISFDVRFGEGAVVPLPSNEDEFKKFIDDRDADTMEFMGRHLTEDEKKWAEYNFDQIQKGNRPEELVNAIGARILFYGLQDHMDSESNEALSRNIREIKSEISRGCTNIVYDEDYNIEKASVREKWARKAGRKVTRDWGVDNDYRTFNKNKDNKSTRENLDEALGAVRSMKANNPERTPMAMFKCVDPETLRELRSFLAEDGEYSDLKGVVIILDKTQKDPRSYTDNILRLLIYANDVLNEKRTGEYFDIPEDNPVRVDLRKGITRRLVNARFLQIGQLFKFGVREDADIDRMSTSQLNELFENLYYATDPNFIINISPVDWKEIPDYNDAMEEVYRSL